MKKIIKYVSLFLAVLIIAASAAVSAAAVDKVTVTFRSNDSSANDVFKSVSVDVGGSLDAFYEVPRADNKAFAGWYYDADGANAVDFSGDNFSENTDLYARWIDMSSFELEGVQLRNQGGMRFVATLSNSLLGSLDLLSDNTVGEYQSRVEYGFIATKQANINRWLEFAGEHLDAQTYELGYNGDNVNGVDTTAQTAAYQGFVTDIDCTASDFSDSEIEDYESDDDHRVYTFAVTYENADDMLGERIAAGAYLRFYDANGLLRTVYGDYSGTDSYGGCSSSYNEAENIMNNIGYYSDVADMVSDANNLTSENGSASPSEAVASMYISGGKAYMKLLADAECGDADLKLNQPADLNLKGNTLSFDSGVLTTNDSFRMYNGEYKVESAETFSVHRGSFTKIKDVSFTADSLTGLFTGLRLNDNAYLYRCSFDVTMNNTEVKCIGTISNGDDVTINQCEYKLCSDAEESDAVRAQVGNILIENSSIHMTDRNGAGDNQVGVYGINDNVTVDSCDLDFSTNSGTVAFYFHTENSVIKNTDINIEGLSDSAAGYGMMSFETNSKDVIKDSEFRFKGSFEDVRGVFYRSVEGVEGMCAFSLENTAVYIDIDSVSDSNFDALSNKLSLITGLALTQDITATVKDYKCEISAVPTGYADVSGLAASGTAKVDIDGCEISFTPKSENSSEWRWLELWGIYINSYADVTLTNADIRVPAFSEDNDGEKKNYNIGIVLYNNSKLTVDESGGPVYVAGGNAGIHTADDSELYISGGKFCSPTHGGAYIGGKSAEITGGEFSVFEKAGFPAYGAMYVTHNAVVNIDGGSEKKCRLLGAMYGIRTRANGEDPNNPVVTVSNSYIRGGTAFSVVVGSIIDGGGNIINQ